MIEKHGEDQTLPAHLVADAFMDLLEARRACHAGQSAEAIALYTGLSARLIGAEY